MITALLLTFAGLAPTANAYEPSNEEFFKNARPLIKAFVAAKSAEYDVEIALDDSTWATRNVTYIRHPFGYDLFYGGRWDYECREFSAVVKPSKTARARFYVRVSYPKNGAIAPVGGANAEYELVPTCNRLAPKAALEMKIDGLTTDRDFTDAEFAAQALPLMQNFLKDNGKTSEIDRASVEIRRRGVDTPSSFVGRAYRALFGRNMACRRVRVVVPGEQARYTAYVSVFYDRADKVDYLPENLQTIHKDRVSLRPYRFSLVNGCDNLGLFERPTLRLKPASKTPPAPAAPAAPVEPKPESDGTPSVI